MLLIGYFSSIFLVNNGVHRFSGEASLAAQEAYDNTQVEHHFSGGFPAFRVLSVELTHDSCPYGHYRVILQSYGLFEMKLGQRQVTACSNMPI